MEALEKSGKVKLTMELEINPAAMDLIKENMSHMMDMASQWRGQGGKGKMEGGHGAMMRGEEKS
ncbi:MAG: hypothetical protein M1540_05730 [Candidatus Bathyarchaeota archaeon]|nr:hypothetical protein [Candidatus Bathyarchaeota archaeon]